MAFITNCLFMNPFLLCLLPSDTWKSPSLVISPPMERIFFHDCQKPSFLHHTPCEGMGRVITMPCMLSTWPGLAEDREHAREHGLGVGDGSGAVLGLGRRGAIQAGAGRCWLVSLLCLGTRPVVDTTSPSRLPCSGTLGEGRGGQRTPLQMWYMSCNSFYLEWMIKSNKYICQLYFLVLLKWSMRMQWGSLTHVAVLGCDGDSCRRSWCRTTG